MKRKVIQIANSTQLISLPRKWAQRYGVNKGDELNVEEVGKTLLLSTETLAGPKKIEIDVTGLDRTSILYYLEALYKTGFDEIVVTFKEPFTIHLRTLQNKKVLSVIHEVVNRLTGFEIIQQKENFCLIKEITESSMKEFDSALRRVFLLLLDANSDLITALKNRDMVLLETIEEKHNTIMKFTSYCLRILNKRGYNELQKTTLTYHIISLMNKIADVFRYSAIDVIGQKANIRKDAIKILEAMHDSLALYYKFFYNFDIKLVRQLYENRNRTLKSLISLIKRLSSAETLLLTKMGSILELVTDMTDARVGLEYIKSQ